MGILKKGFLLLFTLIIVIYLAVIFYNEPIPEGTMNERAEVLADLMLDAINNEAWSNTGAIKWNFDNRQQLIWDKERHLAQVSWGEYVVQVDINERLGLVIAPSNAGENDDQEQLCLKAWKYWANDSFWLNPISKIRDNGTSRSVVNYGGSEALLVSYSQGGVTPGDSYLWFLGKEGLPHKWKMWVSIIPIGGIETSWENWETLETGVKVSTVHSNLLSLKLHDVKAAKSIVELEGKDIFQELFDSRNVLVKF